MAESVTEKSLSEGRVYPRLKEIREISIQIAAEIAEKCYKVSKRGVTRKKWG